VRVQADKQVTFILNSVLQLPAGLARRALSMTILELGAVGFERQKEKIPVYNPMKQMMAVRNCNYN